MKKAVFLTVFVIVCLIQPFYPAWGQDKSEAQKPTIQQLNVALIRLQGQLDSINTAIRYLQDRQKVIMSDGLQIKALIEKAIDVKKQQDDTKSMVDAARDSVAGSGKDK